MVFHPRPWVPDIRELFGPSNYLACALAWRTAWGPKDDLTPLNKVIAVFCANTVDYILPLYPAHCPNGIATAPNSAYMADELEH
ncbi:uncharacterized protein PgNI_12440 [Pyricularia grisea]|uniref:Uncharacterized protein n=1 Tax=Pyricularia grisea TaxID=148305 RepID=A0A6P8AME3_PYRGI|nr:uncharacterized protein PgNI_12440 [Pyricularia grisea]TLD03203.1 hypothetical protein PgNI_12440 [Pyricularia grisea]